ncbi:hypothetical protein CT0861_09837 [Colletotrichum tofieldiae]|uniref:Uncharacterized protein n=1 Tax=Colletotrichum tofieldiae TaxID=708197 RepID=A0A166U3Y5_9PEZI|nr:hypothetical protein CT0861_09837 [Colletotrichum tofieldiae]GKT88841.1 hypothetical protein Ct61P_06691 [Colletotrichum tofieldiae]
MTGHDYSYVGSPAEDIELVSSKNPHSDITTTEATPEAPLSTSRSRYLARTFVLLLVPLGITGYYYWIWLYLLSRDLDEAVKYGSANESWVFWSWFIVGVFALDWAAHGLVGVELAMLETSFWRAPHLIGLLSHSEKTWGGPGGWVKCLTKLFKERNLAAITSWYTSLNTYRLWYLLAFLTLSLYVGMPLSGITMELSDGYVPLDEAPMVVGRNSTDFNARYYSQGSSMTKGAETAWKVGSPAVLPGISIIYTPKQISRKDHDDLAQIPNNLPTNSGAPEMFLVPQARVPVSGTAWGLRAEYNCSVVEDVSEFTILGHYTGESCFGGPQKDCAHAHMVDKSSNIWSYMEVGARMPMIGPPQVYSPTYDDTAPDAFGSGNGSQLDIFEYALWQVRVKTSYAEIENFNSTVGPTVKGLDSPFMKADNGSWVANATFFDQKNYTMKAKEKKDVWQRLIIQGRQTLEVAAPIGVRCVIKSVLGSASIDPVTSTFSDFRTEYPKPPNDPEVKAPSAVGRLGTQVERFVATAGVDDIFTSINTRVTISESNSVSLKKFVSSPEMQKSISMGYVKEVLNLMYDGQYGFEGSWHHGQLASSRKGKILTTGDLSPLAAVIPFAIWTFGSLILGLVYGFRRRAADSLSGFSVFRLGVRSAEKLEGSGLLEAKDAEDVDKLWRLSGSLDK